MGQTKSRYSSVPPLDQTILRRITSATSFLPDEIRYFYYDFLKYTPKGYLTLVDFEELYQTLFRHGAPENFARYVFKAYDVNRDDEVDFEEFIVGLYYSTKASTSEKVRWAFDLCDQDADHQLDAGELEAIIQALYELSNTDMPRVETYQEAIDRIKQTFLPTFEDSEATELLTGVSKDEFTDIVQNDATIMKLIDYRSSMEKRRSKSKNSSGNLLKKQLKFKPTLRKSLSDPTLTAHNEKT